MDFNEVIVLIRKWGEPAIWKIAFHIGAERRTHQQKAKEDFQAAQESKFEGREEMAALFLKSGRQNEEAAEIFRKQIIECNAELLAIQNHLRIEAPGRGLLQLVPQVNFFEEPTQSDDPRGLAAKLIEIEDKLLEVKQEHQKKAASEKRIVADQTDTKTDTKKKIKAIVPENDEITRLASLINKKLGPGVTKKEIAEDFTEGDAKRAQSLLRQLRNYKHLLIENKTDT